MDTLLNFHISKLKNQGSNQMTMIHETTYDMSYIIRNWWYIFRIEDCLESKGVSTFLSPNEGFVGPTSRPRYTCQMESTKLANKFQSALQSREGNNQVIRVMWILMLMAETTQVPWEVWWTCLRLWQEKYALKQILLRKK